MKNRILACLLAAVMLLALASCGDGSGEAPATSAPDAATTAPQEPATDPIPEIGGNSTETVVKLNSTTEGIRFLGIRENTSDAVINCDNPGSGFEISIKSKGGTVKVRTRTANACSFRVLVDGQVWKNAEGSDTFVVNGVKNIEIPNVTEGDHTVRVVRLSDTSVGAVSFYNATFEGELVKIADEQALRVEFVGDGSLLGTDVTKAYAYLTAGKLNAAYAIVAGEGQGLTAGTAPIANSYAKTGDYTKGADVVVLDLGAVDLTSGVAAADLTAAYASFLAAVRAANGPMVKIVCLADSANADLSAAVTAACETAGGEISGNFVLTYTASTADALAQTLADRINAVKDATIELSVLSGTSSGYGVEIDFNAAEWIS